MNLPELEAAIKSALSTIQYVENELKELSDVLPELAPARRCLFALKGEADKLTNAMKIFTKE